MKKINGNPLFGALKLMLVPMIIISVFILVWLKSEITSIEYRISQYESERMNLLKKRKELIVKRSDSLSVKNIEAIAMDKLGLTFPDRKKVIYVKRGEEPYNFKAGLGTHTE
ncbi:MAG: cell division protein FtsL [Nitrospirota bacterium]|nr:MAG: cell division protein FtsL [Nitrospirota bacterium]